MQKKRAAHFEWASTEIYKKGYNQWNKVPDVVIGWQNDLRKSDSAYPELILNQQYIN